MIRTLYRWLMLLPCLLSGTGIAGVPASPDIAALQARITNGQAVQAVEPLAAALEQDPDNARLLYDHGVASYAAGRFEDALVSFDRVEVTGRRWLVRKARFQKGNTEYQIGLTARASNLEETIARWRESLRDFAEILKESDEPRARENFEFVRRQLLDLLLADARRNQAEARKKGQPAGEKIEKLRNAFERFSAAQETDPGNAEAQAGE